jgi:hypothetical protein
MYPPLPKRHKIGVHRLGPLRRITKELEGACELEISKVNNTELGEDLVGIEAKTASILHHVGSCCGVDEARHLLERSDRQW